MIKSIEKSEKLESNESLEKIYRKFESLISELNKKEVPAGISKSINQEIDTANSIIANSNEKIKGLKKIYSGILILVRKEMGFVGKQYYKNLWIKRGLLFFGVPLSLAFYIVSESPGLFAIGMAMGLPIGAAIGDNKSKVSKNNNKLLYL